MLDWRVGFRRRLGKRARAASLATLNERGVSIPEIIGWLGWSLGCLERPEACRAEELIPRFDWERVPAGTMPVPETWI